MTMRIAVGNKITGVTEAEAAKGRSDLADYLNTWWSKANQTSPEKMDISWGAIECQLELSVDAAKSPQILLTGPQSAPRSIKETVAKFLTDTCHVQSVDDHFHIDIQQRFLNSITSRTGQPMETSALLQHGMFGRRPSSAGPKATPETPKIDADQKGPSSTNRP